MQEGCIPAGNNFDEIKDRSSDAEGFDCYCGQGLSADGVQDIILMRLKLEII